jgi:ankyrin repeat protein
MSSVLRRAAIDGANEIIQAECDAGTDVNTTDRYGWTALMLAAKYRREETTDCLLSYGANPELRNTHDRNALHYGISGGNTAVVQALINAGANPTSQPIPHLVWYPDTSRDGEVPLLVQLAREGMREMLDILLETAESATISSALLAACRGGHAEVAHLLLERGAWINYRDKHNQSPLLCAAATSNAKLVAFLLDHGADIHACDASQDNALHIALRNKRANIAQALIRRGADVNATNLSGHKPLHLARGKHFAVTQRLLLQAGATG